MKKYENFCASLKNMKDAAKRAGMSEAEFVRWMQK